MDDSSGPNLEAFLKERPNLARKAKRFKVRFWPGPAGRGYLDWIDKSYRIKETSPADYAFHQFMTLVTNPLWNLLKGPCYRCGDYFLKKRKQQKYCSRTCSSATAAHSSQRRTRDRIQSEKLQSAQEAIDKGRPSRYKRSNNVWVVAETGFSPQWVGRAVNAGKLEVPPDWAISKTK